MTNTGVASNGTKPVPQALAGLVVDDDPVIRMILVECLRKHGMVAAEAKNGFECLDIVARSHFDVIFMDIVMPEMDGIEAIIELRKRAVKSRIIAISAHEKVGDMLLREAALKLGADDAVGKPFDGMALVKNARAALGVADRVGLPVTSY